MRDEITAALKEATKAQDKRRLSTLRLVNAAIKDRDIANRTAGKEPADDDELRAVVTDAYRQVAPAALLRGL